MTGVRNNKACATVAVQNVTIGRAEEGRRRHGQAWHGNALGIRALCAQRHKTAPVPVCLSSLLEAVPSLIWLLPLAFLHYKSTALIRLPARRAGMARYGGFHLNKLMFRGRNKLKEEQNSRWMQVADALQQSNVTCAILGRRRQAGRAEEWEAWRAEEGRQTTTFSILSYTAPIAGPSYTTAVSASYLHTLPCITCNQHYCFSLLLASALCSKHMPLACAANSWEGSRVGRPHLPAMPTSRLPPVPSFFRLRLFSGCYNLCLWAHHLMLMQ